jgi:hypothetical protein
MNGSHESTRGVCGPIGRAAAGLRVLAIVMAVLSLAGRDFAHRAGSGSARTIACVPAQIHALAVMDRAADSLPDERNARFSPLAMPSRVAPWVIAAPVLADEVRWQFTPSDAPIATSRLGRLARGPPSPQHSTDV